MSFEFIDKVNKVGVMKKLGEVKALSSLFNIRVYKCTSGTTTLRQKGTDLGGMDLFLANDAIPELIALLQKSYSTIITKENT